MDDEFFIENTLVEVNVPEDSNLDIEAALSIPEPESDENTNSLIPTIPQRTSLYFDETIPIYVVIRIPREDEEALRAKIPRLAVNVEAIAYNDPESSTPTPNKDGVQQQDVIWFEKLNPTEEPVVVMEESAEEDDVSTALLIWKMTATLSRPRIRLTSPLISWKTTGSLNPPSRVRKAAEGKYLTSGKPLALNLLAPLSDGQGLDEKAPHLTAARLSRPGRAESRLDGRPLPLKALPKPSTRALPALTSRIRFHRSHKMGDLPTIAASLELDVPPTAPAEVELLSVELSLSRGTVEQMAPEHSIKLPKTCQPRDSLVWLYTFSPLRAFDDPMANALPHHVLEVSISARVIISDICKPTTQIKWRTNVDFSTAANTVRRVLDPVIKSAPRPPPARPGSRGRPDSSQGPNSQRRSIEIEHGVDNPEYTVTFISPKRPIYVGEPFRWRVIVVNRTSKMAHFALTAIQKRRPQHGGKRHSHQSSTGSVTAVSKSGAVAEAAIDDNLLYATVKAGGPETAHLVCLSADVKVGPLAPGAAGETELEFLPMIKGWLSPEAVRLTDMATNEFCDVRCTPDILALERDDPKNGSDEG